VAGTLKRPRGTIDAPIGRHPVQRKKMAVDQRKGRPAITEYRVLQSGGGVSLVECALHSGRTHQIRVHLHHLGHPIIGDSLYGKKTGASRQMLHAWKLGFTHPQTKERLFFEAPVPEDFRELQGIAFRQAGFATASSGSLFLRKAKSIATIGGMRMNPRNHGSECHGNRKSRSFQKR